jgi:hypothetical protein
MKKMIFAQTMKLQISTNMSRKGKLVFHKNKNSSSNKYLLSPSANVSTELHTFSLPLFAKIRSNQHQLLNVAALALFVKCRVRDGLQNIYFNKFKKQFSSYDLLVAHPCVYPDVFIHGMFTLVVKRKNVPILLNDIFFEDVCKVLHNLKFDQNTIVEFWECRHQTKEELQNCLQVDVTHKTHIHISFLLSQKFANEFIFHASEHVHYDSNELSKLLGKYTI